MKGYKIAVGISEKYGFFPVMVELEIPDGAVIVEPLLGIPLFSEIGMLDLKPKYRTNICKVTKVYPIEDKSYEDWNGNAFSIYELINLIVGIRTVYKVDNTISVKYIDEDVKHDCGGGIHFFGCVHDAERFYSHDPMSWAYGCILAMNGKKEYGSGQYPLNYFDKQKELCLSFE